MVFSSLVFLAAFLPVTILLYYAIPSVRGKNVLLLLSSLFFYAWGEPKYILLMIASILANYIFGRLIHRQKLRRRGSKLLAAAAVLFNLGLLLYFKYFNFLIDSANILFGTSLSFRDIALPIGISFFTFQGLSYVIDVHREDPEREDTFVVQEDIVKLALYIAMFPQLIAGPIVRYHDIQPYLTERRHSFDRFASGIEVFIVGLAKKVLIANILGETVAKIMEENPDMINAPIAWFGAICYSLQLFYDFSGYSEMAIGLGRMFGFEFQRNFDYPYISRSITEFWRRWHISLSQWFRDYLYIPLGGSRKGNVYLHLFIVFLATGIWHGANFGFILWGLWHGLFILAERIVRNKGLIRFRVPGAVRWLYTMLVAVLGWTIFKIVGLADSFHYYGVMFGIVRPEFVRFDLGWYLDPRTVTVLIAAVLFCVPWNRVIAARLPKAAAVFGRTSVTVLRRAGALVLLAVCFLFISNSTYNPFIYFRF